MSGISGRVQPRTGGVRPAAQEMPAARTPDSKAAGVRGPGAARLRNVRQAAAPRRRGMGWLAFKTAVTSVFRRKAAPGLAPVGDDLGYGARQAQDHGATVLNHLGAARLRPGAVLLALYVAAGGRDAPRQQAFDAAFQGGIRAHLDALPDSQLYRLHRRLRGGLGDYAQALRQGAGGSEGAAAETAARVNTGLERTAAALDRLDSDVTAALAARGYRPPPPMVKPPRAAARSAVADLRVAAARRHAAGGGVFGARQRAQIAAGLDEVVRRVAVPAAAPGGGTLPVSEQFLMDAPREQVRLEIPGAMVRDLRAELPSDAAGAAAHAAARLTEMSGGDEAQGLRLSALLTQASTKDAYAFVAMIRPDADNAVRLPFDPAQPASLPGVTETSFAVRRVAGDPGDDEGVLHVDMDCVLTPQAISEGGELTMLDDRESEVRFSVGFRLPRDGPPILTNASYAFRLQT